METPEDDLEVDLLLRRPVVVVWGLCVPALAVVLGGLGGVFSLSARRDTLPEQASMLLGGLPFLIQLPLVAFAWAGVLSGVLGGAESIARRRVRAALWCGVLTGVWFAGVLVVSSALGMLVAMAPALGLAAPWMFGWWQEAGPDRLRGEARDRMRAATRSLAWGLGGVGLLVAATWLGWPHPGVIAILATVGPLVAAPLLFAVVCGMLLGAVPAERGPGGSSGAAPAAAGGAFALTTALSIQRALADYAALPVSEGDCYVATAASRGHAWLVGAEVVPGVDGPRVVNRQLRVLKAGELALAVSTPRAHRAMRRVYDRVGPWLAGRLTSRWRADLAYLGLVPAAVVTRAVLAVAVPGAGRAIRRLYAGR